MPWEDLVMEVMKRKEHGQKANLLSDDNYAFYVKKREKQSYKKKILAVYELETKYGRRYFTRREAECMVWLLKGKTVNSVAALLKISPRTVEYYIKNMKNKVGCRTKFELVDQVYASDFMRNVDFVT
jgi:DNA-binding CsgD family transcriptional regulator